MTLSAPYLLVVADCKEELPGGRHNGEALLEAVLGTIYIELKISETGEQIITDKRKPDGYWGTIRAPAHGWQPLIVRNGSANEPCQEASCRYQVLRSQPTFDANSGRWQQGAETAASSP